MYILLLKQQNLKTLIINKSEDITALAVTIKAAVAESKPFVVAPENLSSQSHLAV